MNNTELQEEIRLDFSQSNYFFSGPLASRGGGEGGVYNSVLQ